MISSVRPLYAGNALHISLTPPADAKLWRLLRKAADDFTGHDDANALVAYEGTERYVTDAAPGLINETPAFYKPYYWDGSAWLTAAAVTGTPRATYEDASTDALELLRDRIEAGLAVEVQRQVFKPSCGYIQVLTAPPIADKVEFPVVTVHLESDRSGARGVGELVAPDEFNGESGKWFEHEGWLADVQIEVIAWSLNPDERIALRKALRRIVAANLGIFDAAGLVEIQFAQRDVDAISGEFSAPVYQAVCDFTCQAPIIVTTTADPISDVELTVHAEVEPVTN